MRKKLLFAGMILLIASVGFAAAQFSGSVFHVVGDIMVHNNDPFSDWNTAIAEDGTVVLDGSAGTIVMEGTTLDASETTLAVEDPTADVTYEFQTDAADTYEVLAMPDGDVTGGHFIWPLSTTADAVTTTTDNAMLCERLFFPMNLTVANAYVLGVVGTDSGSDETLAFAIYNDADAGTQVTEGVGSDLTTTALVTIDVTDATIGPGMYRFCWCAQDISGAAFHAETRDDEAIDVMNDDAVVFGTAANPCVTGNPPATTGALTTADDNVPVTKIGG